MKRKQIYLEESQERAIKRIARERGVAEAVVVREAMDAYLAEERAPYDEDRSGGDDPILSVVGILDYPDGPRDGPRTYRRDLYDRPGGPL